MSFTASFLPISPKPGHWIKVTKNSVRNLRKKLPQKTGSVTAFASSDFADWLREQGAFAIDDQHGD